MANEYFRKIKYWIFIVIKHFNLLIKLLYYLNEIKLKNDVIVHEII